MPPDRRERDLVKVHDIVSQHIPDLLFHLERMIARLEGEVGWSDEDDQP